MKRAGLPGAKENQSGLGKKRRKKSCRRERKEGRLQPVWDHGKPPQSNSTKKGTRYGQPAVLAPWEKKNLEVLRTTGTPELEKKGYGYGGRVNGSRFS